jgi:hypothetical protein
MKPFIAVVAALLLAPCACARHQSQPQPTAFADPIDPGPAIEPPQAKPARVQVAAEPDPQPTPEEIAAFQAPVPK